MQKLINGFMRFKNDVFSKDRDFFTELASGQHPEVLFITCADSRIVPDVITQTRPGDLFVCRTVGNQIPPHGAGNDVSVASSIEYALGALNVGHIVVCGHSDCGAMKGVLHPEKLASFPSTATWLKHAEAAHAVVQESYSDLPEVVMLRLLAEENVLAQIENLKTHPRVASRLAQGELQIHGWYYEIHSGEITTFDATSGMFQPLGYRPVSATPAPRVRSLSVSAA